jgi:hypothetical protein
MRSRTMLALGRGIRIASLRTSEWGVYAAGAGRATRRKVLPVHERENTQPAASPADRVLRTRCRSGAHSRLSETRAVNEGGIVPASASSVMRPG